VSTIRIITGAKPVVEGVAVEDAVVVDFVVEDGVAEDFVVGTEEEEGVAIIHTIDTGSARYSKRVRDDFMLCST
jgi:hypothetical protein